MASIFKYLRRIRSQKVRVVHDDDLLPSLERMGILQDIQLGKIHCKYTGDVITLDNLHAIVRSSKGLEFISDAAVAQGKLK